MGTFKCPFCGQEITDNDLDCPKCGRSFPKGEARKTLEADMVEQETKDRKITYSFIMLAVAVISVFAFTKFTDSRNPTNASSQSAQPAHEDKADEIDAFVMSQTFVKKELVSPSSAKFPWFDKSMVTQVDEDTWIINSYVDSQNKFGAMLRTNYIAKIKYLGNDKWGLLDLAFYEK
jgi:hypothetical protein